MRSKKTFHLTSLGCAKNNVDSESMAQLLQQQGYRRVRLARQAAILIVNTCGFIESAREESYHLLHTLAQAKRPGQLLIAAGCLTQRYGAEVARMVPGVDGILGTRRWVDIVDLVQQMRTDVLQKPRIHLPPTPCMVPDPVDVNGNPRVMRASIFGASAYLKIADGCRRSCAFCAIPSIKGTLVSRPVDMIVQDASHLHELGVRELILIAQDTTDYGFDLGLKDGLSILLDELVTAVPDMEWIRIMYSFPGAITDRLIDTMAAHAQVLPYLDIPLQHADPRMLTSMQRPSDLDWVHRTIEKMRLFLPGLAIRTTFIVGYPGETEQQFQALLDFVEQVRFDRLGVFKFSFEKGTASEALGDPISEDVKEKRYQRLMELQQLISLDINRSFLGNTIDVLIEGQQGDSLIGRSYRDAPEIDGLVLCSGRAEIGSIVPVNITAAYEYDLSGKILS